VECVLARTGHEWLLRNAANDPRTALIEWRPATKLVKIENTQVSVVIPKIDSTWADSQYM
jgi:hypothetical protein